MDFRYDNVKLEDYKWNWKAIFGWTIEKDIMQVGGGCYLLSTSTLTSSKFW